MSETFIQGRVAYELIGIYRGKPRYVGWDASPAMGAKEDSTGQTVRFLFEVRPSEWNGSR
jgi:hypothetical protein